MKTKTLTATALFIAIGTFLGHLIYIPVGVAKCFPVQHAINVMTAILLGPYQAVACAFSISLLRNILGTGSLLAFPGSMFGAFLAGLIFKITRNYSATVIGEIVGTGILGGIASYPIAKYILGKDIAVLFFVVPFLVSTIGGSLIGYLIIKIIKKD